MKPIRLLVAGLAWVHAIPMAFDLGLRANILIYYIYSASSEPGCKFAYANTRLSVMPFVTVIKSATYIQSPSSLSRHRQRDAKINISLSHCLELQVRRRI